MKAFYEDRRYRENHGFSASYAETMNFFAHWHKEIEMMYVLEGEIGIGLDRDYRVLKSGDLSISESNGIHYYNSQGYKSKTVMIIFKPELFAFKGQGLENVCVSSAFIGCPKDDGLKRRIESIIEEIVEESTGKDNFYDSFINLKLSELFLNLFRYDEKYYAACLNTKAKAPGASLMPMQKALKYLEENYTEEITLKSLSEKVGLSPFYFSRLFKNTTGTNYSSYLTQLRVDNAEYIIKTTGGHIIDIAYQTGFKSIRTFNRAFKTLRGYTPQSVRE